MKCLGSDNRYIVGHKNVSLDIHSKLWEMLANFKNSHYWTDQ